MTTPPAFQPNAGQITAAYDFEPTGVTFDQPVIVRFNYDPTLIPSGVEKTSLQIAYYDSIQNAWITLPSTIDTNNHFIFTQITNFNVYAVTYGVEAVTEATIEPLATTAPSATTTTDEASLVTTTPLTTLTSTELSEISPPPVPTTDNSYRSNQLMVTDRATTTGGAASTKTTFVGKYYLLSVILMSSFLIVGSTILIGEIWFHLKE
jgi:hypothetical protein